MIWRNVDAEIENFIEVFIVYITPLGV